MPQGGLAWKLGFLAQHELSVSHDGSPICPNPPLLPGFGVSHSSTRATYIHTYYGLIIPRLCFVSRGTCISCRSAAWPHPFDWPMPSTKTALELAAGPLVIVAAGQTRFNLLPTPVRHKPRQTPGLGEIWPASSTLRARPNWLL
jgi:hypothetical protein